MSELVTYERINPTHKVVRSNELMESSYQLSISELRIILILASKIQKDDKDLKLYHFRASEIADVVGVKADGYYSALKTHIKELQKKQLEIKEGKKLKVYNWLILSEYNESEGSISLQFHPHLKKHFVGLKKYTKMLLEELMQFNSFHTVRIYDLLKQYMKVKERKITVEELRFHLGIEKGEYKQYGHLKSRIINRAVAEINQKSDIIVSYEEKKQKNKVVRLDFTFSLKEDAIPAEKGEPKPELPDSADSDWVFEELLKIGLLRKDAEAITKRYSKNRIIGNIKYVYNRRDNPGPRQGPLHSLSSYTKTAISKDFAKTEGTPEVKQEPKPKKKKTESEDKLQLAKDKVIAKYENSSELVPEWLIREGAIETFAKTLEISKDEASALWDKHKDDVTETIHEAVITRKSRRR